MHEFPSAFRDFLNSSPVVQEFLAEESWGDKLRKRLQETDPHWKILAWREYPEHKAVAAVVVANAGVDLFIFWENGPKNLKDLQYWSVDPHYDDKLPKITAYWHFLGEGIPSDPDEILATYTNAIDAEEENITRLIEGKAVEMFE